MDSLAIALSEQIKNLNTEQKLVKALNRLGKKATNSFLKQAVLFQLQDLVKNKETISADKS